MGKGEAGDVGVGGGGVRRCCVEFSGLFAIQALNIPVILGI